MQIKKTVEGITKILDPFFSSSKIKVLGNSIKPRRSVFCIP